MALKYWWLLPVGLAVLGTVLVLLFRRGTAPVWRLPVAHTERLTALPAYQNALRQRRTWLTVAVAAVAVLALSLLVAAARPVTERTSIPEQLNRDIILCLDVSGSMLDTDEAIVSVFSTLVANFKGERIGLTIFDSTAVTVFPLTDDYEFVANELKIAQKALNPDASSFDYFTGTYEAPGSSLIGDGLASCINGFPAAAQSQRSRSVIFATDNLLAGKPLFSLAEATTLAQKDKIRIYSLNPNDFGMETFLGKAAQGLKTTSASTGGAYFALESESAVPGIMQKVQATEAALLKGAPQRSVLDQPGWALGMALLSLLMLGVAGWRLRR